MEKMPYRSELDVHQALAPVAVVSQPATGNAVSTDWRQALPTLRRSQRP